MSNEIMNLCFKYEKKTNIADPRDTTKDQSGMVFRTYTELDLHEL